MIGLERLKVGIWDDGTLAGVGVPESQFGKRPDLTIVEYVRADLHDGSVRLTEAERDRLLWWLYKPTPPGPMKDLDMAMIRKLEIAAVASPRTDAPQTELDTEESR